MDNTMNNLMNNIGRISSYAVLNLSALLAMMMVTEPFAVCGVDGLKVLTYQMAQYIPQTLMMVIGPFLSYITCLEPISTKWKVVKLIVIGVLFTVSMITAFEFGIPMLEAEFGSAEKELHLLPVMFYCHLAVSLMTLFLSREDRGATDGAE